MGINNSGFGIAQLLEMMMDDIRIVERYFPEIILDVKSRMGVTTDVSN